MSHVASRATRLLVLRNLLELGSNPITTPRKLRHTVQQEVPRGTRNENTHARTRRLFSTIRVSTNSWLSAALFTATIEIDGRFEQRSSRAQETPNYDFSSRSRGIDQNGNGPCPSASRAIYLPPQEGRPRPITVGSLAELGTTDRGLRGSWKFYPYIAATEVPTPSRRRKCL